MCLAGLHCFRVLPPPGDGLADFSGGKGHDGAYRPGEGSPSVGGLFSTDSALKQKLLFSVQKQVTAREIVTCLRFEAGGVHFFGKDRLLWVLGRGAL
jgi:hypothetical protein